jgi:hypothetical protein
MMIYFDNHDTILMDLVFIYSKWPLINWKRHVKMGHEDQPNKIQVMTDDSRDITLNNIPIVKVKEFVFLGSNIPSVEEDVKRRTRIVVWSFGRLNKYNLVKP